MGFRRKKYKEKRVGKTLRADQALGRVVKRLGGSEPLSLVRLWGAWPEIFSPELARMARPLGHKGRTLILGGHDPMALQELGYYSEEILSRVNGFLGQIFFDKVRCELVNGRAFLDEIRPTQVQKARPKFEKPHNLGNLKDTIDPDSAVGKCYRAYVDDSAK